MQACAYVGASDARMSISGIACVRCGRLRIDIHRSCRRGCATAAAERYDRFSLAACACSAPVKMWASPGGDGEREV